MAGLKTKIYVADSSGKTIVDDFANDTCKNCIADCRRYKKSFVECYLQAEKRRVCFTSDELGQLWVCDGKEKTTKNFRTMAELVSHSRPALIAKFNEIETQAKRKVIKELEAFKHNIVHINSDAINEFYSFIPQDTLIQNYRKLQSIVRTTIKEDPEEAVELIARLAKYILNTKTELSVFSKLNTPDTKPSFNSGNPRDAIMSSVYMLYPIFKSNGVYINVGEYREKFDIDYEALQVAAFYIIENAAKYSAKGSSVNVDFIRKPHNLAVEFSMYSFYIDQIDEKLIFAEGFQGLQAKNSDRGGSGLGLYRAKRLVVFFGGELTVEAGDNSQYEADGYQYANNKFIIELPVKVSVN